MTAVPDLVMDFLFSGVVVSVSAGEGRTGGDCLPLSGAMIFVLMFFSVATLFLPLVQAYPFCFVFGVIDFMILIVIFQFQRQR